MGLVEGKIFGSKVEGYSVSSALRTDMRPLTTMRFFAAMWVVFFHFGASALSEMPVIDAAKNLANSGYLGVSFFFILSGFILTSVYRGRVGNFAEIKVFFVARLSRIYPVYILSLLLMLPSSGFVSPIDSIIQILMLQGWFASVESARFHWNVPAWTLSVELFFYAAFVPVASVLPKLRLWVVAVAGVGVALLICWWGLARIAPGVQLTGLMAQVPLMLLRFPEFILGCVLAEALSRLGAFRRSSTFDLGLALAAACLIMVCGLVPDAFRWAPLVFVMIIAFGAISDGPIGKILSNSWLVFLGGVSYSIYLLQDAVNWLFDNVFGQGILSRILMPIFLILLSMLVYSRFEEPIRRWFRGRR